MTWSARVLLAMGLAGGVLAGPAAAEVYRWVDEQGKVHFGDRPPATAPAEALDLDVPPAVDGPDRGRMERQRRFLDVTEEERRREAAARREAQAERERRAENCRRARDNLARVRRARYLYQGTDGERRVYSEEERAQVSARMEQTWCD